MTSSPALRDMAVGRKATESIAGIVVSYFPDDEFSHRIQKLSTQVDHIIVVDNGSKGYLESKLRDCSSLIKELISNEKNLGVAHALNSGVERARRLGVKWVATFDQDSEVGPDYRVKMMHAWNSLIDTHDIALLAPAYVYASLGQTRSDSTEPRLISQETPREIRTVMTSGNVVPCSTFDRVGPYRADFIIDYVDHEFCFRCRRAGLHIFEVPDLALAHNLGRIERTKLGPLSATVTHHSPMRRYFITRNRLCTWREHGIRNWQWTLGDMIGSMKEMLKIVMFESEKTQKNVAAFFGVLDAIRGRMGWGSSSRFQSVHRETRK